MMYVNFNRPIEFVDTTSNKVYPCKFMCKVGDLYRVMVIYSDYADRIIEVSEYGYVSDGFKRYVRNSKPSDIF